jgi:hypothetical protein
LNNAIGRIRATSDSLLDDLESLRRLEEEKRDVPLNTPRFHELAAKIEEISRAVMSRTERQRELGLEVARSSTTINETPREMSAILAEWREAERRLADAEPGSPEEARARADVERCRDEYREASDPSRQAAPAKLQGAAEG